MFNMEIDTMKESFDHVAEKQALSITKAQEVIDQLIKVTDEAVLKLRTSSSEQLCSPDHSSVLAELKSKLNEMAPVNQLEGCQKELNTGLAKYSKVLEKSFQQDISKAHRDVGFDTQTINEIIANHLYRKGLFDIADCFTQEAGLPEDASLKAPFQEMYMILESMQARNLGPALAWAGKHRDQLLQNGSSLELKLHQLQFVEVVAKGNKIEALRYARTHLKSFASAYKEEIQKTMACILWAGRLEHSPYAGYTLPSHWYKLSEELSRQFCYIVGQPYESPLSVVLSAGIQGLPTLLKLSTVMATKKQEWQAMKQLPIPIDLGPEFQFHSVFVCPVLRDQATDENPPMLLACGHVISKQSVMKLSKNSTRPFKCPYCPLEANVSQCRLLHF